MKVNNFISSLYAGHFESKLFNDFKDVSHNDTTHDIVSKYRSISRQFPPADTESHGPLAQALLERLKQARFFGLSIPEEYGGVGLSLREYLLVVEEIAAQNLVLGFTAIAHLSIGLKGIILFGTEAQKQKYLPRAANGDTIFSYALTEPNTGSDAQHIETTAVLSEDKAHYLLNGRKTYITNANFAGAMTVFAQLDPDRPGFMGAFIVETDMEGVRIGKEMPKMGLKASSTAAVHFKNVNVPVENMLGSPGDGFKIAMTILNYGRLALGAASVGIMDRSLADMKQRAANRKQFGMPIGHYELVQEKLVTTRVNRYIISAMTGFAASQLEKDPLAPVAIESSHCKLFGTTRAWETLYDAMQVSGGAGYLSTLPYEQRMRDFRVTTIFEGTTEIHSIYPAIFTIKNVLKEMDEGPGGQLHKLLFLIKYMFLRNDWHLSLPQKELRRMVRTAKTFTRQIRFLIAMGLLIYGKRIIQHQFYLRKITHLSMYCLGILSALARINSALKSCRNTNEDVALVSAFMEDATRFQKQQGILRLRRKERLTKKIMHYLLR